jgi:acetoin utilization deacetylase AcuC-like enzyme
VEIEVLSESRILHRPLTEHPENPSRVDRILGALKSSGFTWRETSIKDTGLSLEEQLKIASRVHAKGYLEYILRLSKLTRALIDEDTYVSQGSIELALATLTESYNQALYTSNMVFLISRPPGHHAGRGGRAMNASTQGFCILNNAAASVVGFTDRGLRRIAILDFDAHHGNGTMEIFYRERVLQVDLHEDPAVLYPHTGYPEEMGEGEGFGYKVNLVLPVGCGDDLYMELVERARMLLEKYSPEALVVSAGFDAFLNDGLADLAATEVTYYKLGLLVKSLNVPTVLVLEGGYSVGLERGLISFVEGLMGLHREYTAKTRTPRALFRRAIIEAERVLERASRRVM